MQVRAVVQTSIESLSLFHYFSLSSAFFLSNFFFFSSLHSVYYLGRRISTGFLTTPPPALRSQEVDRRGGHIVAEVYNVLYLPPLRDNTRSMYVFLFFNFFFLSRTNAYARIIYDNNNNRVNNVYARPPDYNTECDGECCYRNIRV